LYLSACLLHSKERGLGHGSSSRGLTSKLKALSSILSSEKRMEGRKGGREREEERRKEKK
jgi:hypothetical protein